MQGKHTHHLHVQQWQPLKVATNSGPTVGSIEPGGDLSVPLSHF